VRGMTEACATVAYEILLKAQVGQREKVRLAGIVAYWVCTQERVAIETNCGE